MNDTTTRQAIVVGVDGSDSAWCAARWAAREAERHHVPLELVHVCYVPPVLGRYPAPLSERYDEALVESGQAWLDLAAAEVREEAPGVEVDTSIHMGPVAGTLIEHSRGARLMVLGSRGLGGFAGLLIGSVGIAFAAHGACPVVIVPHGEPEHEIPSGGPVLVGIDGSPVSDPAIGFAFEAASERGVPLVAVHVWNRDTVDADWPELSIGASHEEEASRERMVFAERLAGWREKYPDVAVEPRVLRGRPADVLLAEASAERGNAQLIVVGSRGRGPLTGLGLGSVSQAVLHHSRVPVAIVRPGTGD
ncbi:universal stress protein [Haloechinothrix sp. LS1_15]|uniref:universal stress protein n=1 Tax=Haloechinothrix sp. LS1_15 TaxID=2652248 RepID=UPI0029482052|nr:universal stress protein [Haloechinothrix sp. LS1_15]MDV6014220.1 universal stress protein [Haloechinothrix sp. LS1_15]